VSLVGAIDSCCISNMLRSSITLFMYAAPGEPVFRQVLDQYFGGVPDPATEQRI
jgi:uncharacterized protein (DUF1810 family)